MAPTRVLAPLMIAAPIRYPSPLLAEPEAAASFSTAACPFLCARLHAALGKHTAGPRSSFSGTGRPRPRASSQHCAADMILVTSNQLLTTGSPYDVSVRARTQIPSSSSFFINFFLCYS